MPVTYIIVDDEPPGRANLRLAMESCPDWHLLAECESAIAARNVLATASVDVIFLDIQMPRETGLALARELSRLPAPPLIIFVTAFNAYAVDAFEVHALDYLLKPIDDRRLAQTVERAAQMLRYRQPEGYGNALRGYVDFAPDRYPAAISVRSIGYIEQIRVADVLWLQSAGNYVELHLASRKVLHRIPLSRLESLLRPDDFLRVHRAAIVRRDQIKRLSVVGDGRYLLTLRCDAQVPVSERYVDALKACM
ncbi:DNA-binding response regulator [Duganella rhizosphaerae]|uniref:LytR/AlgR family response regulator transcription factor n=1 Tax=Duganella rhizosphaerae TaxID=2885763 RepID=UPI0030E7C4FD